MSCDPSAHRLEYSHLHQGIEYFICLACGETIERYHDVGSGDNK